MCSNHTGDGNTSRGFDVEYAGDLKFNKQHILHMILRILISNLAARSSMHRIERNTRLQRANAVSNPVPPSKAASMWACRWYQQRRSGLRQLGGGWDFSFSSKMRWQRRCAQDAFAHSDWNHTNRFIAASQHHGSMLRHSIYSASAREPCIVIIPRVYTKRYSDRGYVASCGLCGERAPHRSA